MSKTPSLNPIRVSRRRCVTGPITGPLKVSDPNVLSISGLSVSPQKSRTTNYVCGVTPELPRGCGPEKDIGPEGVSHRWSPVSLENFVPGVLFAGSLVLFDRSEETGLESLVCRCKTTNVRSL